MYLERGWLFRAVREPRLLWATCRRLAPMRRSRERLQVEEMHNGLNNAQILDITVVQRAVAEFMQYTLTAESDLIAVGFLRKRLMYEVDRNGL